jgi:hypothetical protein
LVPGQVGPVREDSPVAHGKLDEGIGCGVILTVCTCGETHGWDDLRPEVTFGKQAHPRWRFITDWA